MGITPLLHSVICDPGTMATPNWVTDLEERTRNLRNLLERYFTGGLLAGICGVCGWVPRPCSLPVDATEAIATAGGSSGRVNRF